MSMAQGRGRAFIRTHQALRSMLRIQEQSSAGPDDDRNDVTDRAHDVRPGEDRCNSFFGIAAGAHPPATKLALVSHHGRARPLRIPNGRCAARSRSSIANGAPLSRRCLRGAPPRRLPTHTHARARAHTPHTLSSCCCPNPDPPPVLTIPSRSPPFVFAMDVLAMPP